MTISTPTIPLQVKGLDFRYHTRTDLAIKDISLTLHPGQVMLVAGTSGCGKTTLMRCINGLAPRIYQGEMKGNVLIFGQPVTDISMSQLSQQVGTLLQDPERQIVSSHVFNEVAFGLENLSLPRQRIIYRVNETLEYLGIGHLCDRETFQLSGGEKQKVALAGVLAMQPKILLLDEPLSSLDPTSAVETLQIIRKLANDGIAIMLVEHRVEDVLAIHPEQVVYLQEGRLTYQGGVDGFLEVADTARVKLPAETVVKRTNGLSSPTLTPAMSPPSPTELVKFDRVKFGYRKNDPLILKDINFTVHQGDIIAILGPNGAGKTTLVKHALGLLKPTSGNVFLDSQDTRHLTVAQSANTIGYVFQSPTQMLFAPTVEEELQFGPKNLHHAPENIQQDVDWALETVHMQPERKTPPLALSFGQQKRVSIAAILAMRSRILMMDEPTAGQDYWNYLSFMDSILQMPGFDAILFITHDLDLALIYANRILLMKDGAIAADGCPEKVLANEALLRSARVLPTSLLRLNLELLSQTGRFLRAEALAKFHPSLVRIPEV
jgi:energy-coupling factor transporter ATP-binding protein EcfA2